MNITHLIRKGKLEPITVNDRYGVTMLIGWRRKGRSRKHGEFSLKRPSVWIDRQKIAEGKALTPGAQIIMDERKRQVVFERFDAERDDRYTNGELAAAASCYMAEPDTRCLHLPVVHLEGDACIQIPDKWPWDPTWWKPGDRIRELAKAGALYLAESSRLKRAEMPDAAIQAEGLAMACAKMIDDIYQVGAVSPGPWMSEPTAGGDN
jgi:hypothetical protein